MQMKGCSAAFVALVLAALGATPGYASDEDNTVRTGSDCISVAQIRRTEVIDDRTVLFYMTGGRIRKVSLAFRCASLRFYGSFSYRTYTSRLCPRVDEIVSRSGSHCPIGDIDDISAKEAEALKRDKAEDGKDD